MNPLSRDDMISFLVRRKHPFAKPPPLAPGGRTNSGWSQEKADAADRYRAELALKPLSELKAVHDAEREAQDAEFAKERERKEAAYSWNQPVAKTDYGFWAKAATWTLDEATALSLGRDPHRVTWDTMKPYTQVSAFAKRYERQRDLIQRARGAKQLYDPVLPGIFIAWAQRTGVELDAGLVEAVEAQGVQVADWKALYDNMFETAQRNKGIAENALGRVAELEKQQAAGKELFDKAMAAVDVHKQREAVALARVEELEASLAVTGADQGKGLKTRERNTLLKILLGLAIDGYGYRPHAPRAATPREISDHLANHGISVSDDTIRKYLNEAAEFAPPRDPE